ncbi:hypothetical protein K2X33_14860 [bacterium]|jgi:hypothetical protein|nr:hypothetical protein [bacterium]
MVQRKHGNVDAEGAVTVRIRGKGSRSYNVKFGDVVVSGKKPSRELVVQNVERSTEALERVGKKFVKPGVSLRFKSGVPSYYADENEPGVFFRYLDGKTQRGRLINGKFQIQP